MGPKKNNKKKVNVWKIPIQMKKIQFANIQVTKEDQGEAIYHRLITNT